MKSFGEGKKKGAEFCALLHNPNLISKPSSSQLIKADSHPKPEEGMHRIHIINSPSTDRRVGNQAYAKNLQPMDIEKSIFMKLYTFERNTGMSYEYYFFQEPLRVPHHCSLAYYPCS